MAQMQVARELGVTGSTLILRLTGPLSLATLEVLEESLRQVGDVDMVIDLSRVPYVDSAGLGTILSGFAHAQRTGHKFGLTGTHPRINLLLDVTKVDMIIPIFKSAEEADRAFTTRIAGA